MFPIFAGEVALPGGKVEEGDEDDVATAIREAKEEIGLDACLVNVVTVLEPFHTKVSCCLCSSILPDFCSVCLLHLQLQNVILFYFFPFSSSRYDLFTFMLLKLILWHLFCNWIYCS